MALIEFSFYSEILELDRNICVALPETGGTFPVLYLYHGYGGTYKSWAKDMHIDSLAKEKGIAIVMPDAWKSYYTNMVSGDRYLEHIANEIPAVISKIFKISNKRQDTYVGGFSMGGYGAIKIAMCYPEKFSHVVSISGVVDLNYSSMMNSKLFDAIFGKNYVFKGSEHDLTYLISKCKKNSDSIPKLYLCCGTEDSFINCNRTFSEYCKENSLDFEYNEGKGGHDREFINSYFEKILNWLP